MLTPIEILTEANPSQIVSRIDIAPRAARFAAMPEIYAGGIAGQFARAQWGTTDLYSHQAKTLELARNGSNVVMATPTASGKTVPIQLLALETIAHSDANQLWLFPTKALCGDQLARMRATLSSVGYSPTLAHEFNGDIPTAQRLELLASCRIAICTPDIVHAWLMRSYTNPAVAHFLGRVECVFLDEAHTYDGVLGTNMAFLLRRLQEANRRTRRALRRSERALQFIAASGTIAKPADHLYALTGQQFIVVGEDDNGAPFAGLTVAHVDFPSHGAAAERAYADYIRGVVDRIGGDACIGFADGRQVVERIVRYIGYPQVRPYRAGYDLELRRDTEGLLRTESLKGVVSTSSLEVGIDVPQFTIGFTLGLPWAIKNAQQRMGRIGRTKPGAFAFCTQAAAFAQLGMTLREYVEGPVEPSHLYLENQLIQYGNARCFVEEFAPQDDEIPQDWAPGFATMVQAAMPGGVRPRAIAQIAPEGSSPHHAHPLRSISEREFVLKTVGRSGHVLGTISADKALRETAPGAIYLHHKKAYRVVDWRESSYENVIFLEPASGSEITRPMLWTQINVSEDPADRLDNRYRCGPSGSLAEVCLRVYEAVEGLTIGSKAFPYRELCQQDSRLRRKAREYSSTGAVIRISEPWFAGSSENAVETRRTVAEALLKVMCREFSIAPGDIRSAHTGIALYTSTRPQKIDDAIVIFDTALGGLRVSAPAFQHADILIERLRRAVTIAGDDALLDAARVERLHEWLATLETSTTFVRTDTGELGEGELMVFAPDSEVGVRTRGGLVQRRLLQPQFVSLRGEELLMYRYETAPGVEAWVAHDEVEPIGHNWRKAIWTPSTNVIREIAA